LRDTTLRALLLASATLAGPAMASPYPDLYVFGDSLYDNGQFDGQRFTNRIGPDYQNSPYGPVSPDFIADGLRLAEAAASRAGGDNYAVTGNTSVQVLQSITAATTYQSPYALDRPGQGLDPNFNSFFYNLENRGQSVKKNALHLLDGGGNDIGNGQVLDDDDAARVASNMIDAANALRGRGAKYVVIANVPDVGLTPLGSTFGDFPTIMSVKVNTQLLQQLGSENILLLNSFALVQDVRATPSAYGIPLTSAQFSRACFSESAGICPEGNANAKAKGSNPDPDQFFFNDFYHGTTIAQQITGDYTLSVLQAPGEISLLPQMGIDDMQSQWRSAHPIMRANRWEASTPVGSFSVWGGANWNEDDHETDYNNTGTNKASQYNVGVNFRPSESWYFGWQFGRGDNELDFGASASRYEMDSLNLTLLGGYNNGPWFFEGAVSYSDLDYDQLKRKFSLGPVLQRTETADTTGTTLGVKFNAGLNLVDSGSNYRFGPIWGLEYIDADVDGYSEKGSTATALRVKDMSTTAGIISAGLFADRKLGFCDCEIYSELTYRGHVDNDVTDPRIGLVSLPGNSAKLPGYDQDDDSIRWDVGLEATLGQATSLNVTGGLTDADNGDAFWYGAELVYSF
jgi:outer membrane lipase/esterase